MDNQAMRNDGFYKSELDTAQIARRINRALAAQRQGRVLRGPTFSNRIDGRGRGWFLTDGTGKSGRRHGKYYLDGELRMLAKQLGVGCAVWLKVSGTRWTSSPPTTEG